VRFGRRFLLFAVGYAAICSLAFAWECSEAGGGKLLTGWAAKDGSLPFSEGNHSTTWR